MITFIFSLCLLIAGYFVYGKFTEKIFGIKTNRQTPAFTKRDDVDYIPMKSWKIFMIQFLNIAGLGPVFGAIMGAKFGVSSYLWIVFGSLFAGAVHDYMSGMMSLRMDGASLPEIQGKYLGNGVKQLMRVFMVVLMILVGVVFVIGPAGLLAGLTSGCLPAQFWIYIIIIYYLLATLLPIDKIIGRIYPVFGFCILVMAVGILVSIFVYHPALPEIWQGLGNKHPQAETNPVFPMMFVSIACGAISGFHATQSPLMARCMTNEKQGRPIFYGAMIAEGIVALIWAAAASYFFFDTAEGKSIFETGTNASVVVDSIARHWMGTTGAVLVILGVIFAPITTGDTAFRSARLIIADFLNLDQKPISKRLLIAVPLFVVAIIVLLYSLYDANGFETIWRYFAWSNQTLSVFTLWTVTVYLSLKKKPYIITLIPALFMTMVCSAFVFVQKEGFLGLDPTLAYVLSGIITMASLIGFIIWKKNEPSKTTS
ncbi:MAG: carbon starvation protein A [Dysgonamonadaceae bacterium]|jgi:carbon starvation protein CstA|nr:carbon starvation protein A [Dysgonamonadaceae bacterium]